MRKHIYSLLFFLLAVLASPDLMAQANVSGKVTDAITGDPLAGVNIVVKGTVTGTISDTDGAFTINLKTTPATLVFSIIGFATQEVEITADNANLEVKMEETAILGEEIVISASRTEESILESPVTVEKMDILSIQQTATPSFYDGLANVKGVHVNQGSLTFTSINTRGFAAIANTRFVQLMDGMDNAAPLLNFPTGNIVGISELDMESMELVPGAASALYGPNAFNGILFMNSKNPFDYQGTSMQVKAGITDSEAGGTAPFTGFMFRHAMAFNNKVAFKVNFEHFDAEDWRATNYTTGRATTGSPSEPVSSPNFDGLNLYGDETPIPTPIGIIRRTGWQEQDLLESNDARSIKASAALHYRITDNLEASYSFRYGSGSTVYQGGERYALRDFSQLFHKLELKGDNFFVRGYMSQTDDGDSYNMSAMGATMNELLFPTVIRDGSGNVIGGWVAAYSTAFSGALAGAGIPGGNHAAARAFADSPEAASNPSLNRGYPAQGRPDVGSGPFEVIKARVRNGVFQSTTNPGAGFIDDSRLYHAEFNYQFDQVEFMDIQVGGNWRQYDLFSDGTIFNEDPDGDGINERIKINEFGFYTQLSKRLLDDRLKLSASLRYDKNENFDGQFNPRFSTVYSAGANRQHNFRASFQTGFRNPDTQAQFIYFPLGVTNLIGGAKANAERYNLYGFDPNDNSGGVWEINSYNAFLASGDSSVLVGRELNYVKPERLTSYEIGYKGKIGDKLLIDVNYYYASYEDFIVQQNVASKTATTHKGATLPAGTRFRANTNADQDITSQGAGLGLVYQLPKGYRIEGNYSWATFDQGDAPADFEAGFNTPENRFSVALSNREIFDNFGFNIAYRWQEEFFWQNSFAVGQVDAFGVLDAQISMKIPSIKTIAKIGATNILADEYVTNVGGPNVGSMYYISLTFDEFMR